MSQGSNPYPLSPSSQVLRNPLILAVSNSLRASDCDHTSESCAAPGKREHNMLYYMRNPTEMVTYDHYVKAMFAFSALKHRCESHQCSRRLQNNEISMSKVLLNVGYLLEFCTFRKTIIWFVPLRHSLSTQGRESFPNFESPLPKSRIRYFALSGG